MSRRRSKGNENVKKQEVHNNSERAAPLFEHFFPVTARWRREIANLMSYRERR